MRVTINVQRSNGQQLLSLERSKPVASKYIPNVGQLLTIGRVEYVVESVNWGPQSHWHPVVDVVVNLSDASKQRFGISA
jgi:hypothetical protein